MRIAYVDMVGGAAGDMLLAAWIDAGADAIALERALRSVVPAGWEFGLQPVERCGIRALHCSLIVPGEDGHHGRRGPARHLADVLRTIERSGLTQRQIERASAIYRRLAEAEARVHGIDVDHVHFHEVGERDAILDVAGTCVALDLLGIDELRCSAFPYGGGRIEMAHGSYPNPGPATMELLRGMPLRALDIDSELVTPTAAAILTTLATAAPTRPDMTLEAIGYGAGRRAFAGIPNVVRIAIGQTAQAVAPARRDDAGDGSDVVVLEANIDDMPPQFYQLAMERLFAAGAYDVWTTPIVMKKGRPAQTLSAIAPPSAEDAVAHALLRETSTIGVRTRRERRYVLEREIERVMTSYGEIRFKCVRGGAFVRRMPEYDDVVRIARERDLPLAEVTRVALQAIETAVRV